MTGRRLVATAPCARCPFRRDVPIYLRADRRREIVRSLIDGAGFHCHADVEWSEDDDGSEFVESTGAQCAGAAKAVALDGGSVQAVRLAERLGEATDLDRGPDVWSLSEWPLVPEGETGETFGPDDVDVETCATVNAGCLAPAGFLGVDGSVVSGTVAADGVCVECEEPLCSVCADENGRCSLCSDVEEEES